ncbi:acyl-CoA-binding domain-containing protein 5 [Adelges cooleyi]|uniref:acyl-CoA-binding domain-containing protein 5 n=1 Tax=Adelges cooleyi TaxID=133065 RepID=UPI0021805586|nr:acyl-CoA-binding domain-containing protein 5 [Adelges cooleyi]XP_050426939.1 acyl-CoA-binding domain-containing protein 5 [Adelges cooleyi]
MCNESANEATATADADMSVEQRFTAAVNVIRSLPKNGSYQPSKELMLRFYAYYKQGTIGPNNQPKPNFWDIVNRAKWQAWDNLRDMSKEKAMQLYVDELKKIVETMAYTNPVADFVSSLDSFSESVSLDDLEMAVGPLSNRNGSYTRKTKLSNNVGPNEQSQLDMDIDEECFHDVMESTGDLKKHLQNNNDDFGPVENQNYRLPNDVEKPIPIIQQNGIKHTQRIDSSEIDDLQLQIKKTVTCLKNDLEVVANRVLQLELKLNKQDVVKKRKHHLFNSRNALQMLLLLGWPVAVQLLFVWFQRRNKHKA